MRENEAKEKQMEDIAKLCRLIRNYVKDKRWDECEVLIPKYMELYPHSAIPHNLMGIMLEKQGKHPQAMCHFRAAAALDASYLPAGYNMKLYSAFEKTRDNKEPAYDEADCEDFNEKSQNENQF